MVKLQMSLGLTHGLGSLPVSLSSLLISELSPLELEIALENALTELRHMHPPSDGNGNYFFSNGFNRKCQEAKGSVSQAELLDHPQIIVGTDDDGNYVTNYNTILIQRIEDKLNGFKREGNEYQLRQCFSLNVKENLEWTIQQQVNLVDYLLKQQADYLRSKNPMDLKSISLRDVGDFMGQSISSIDRLARNLSIQLPQGDKIFAKELITALNLKYKQGVYLLKQFQHDPNIYAEGKWKVSKRRLISLLHEYYEFEITDKPLNKYLRDLELQ